MSFPRIKRPHWRKRKALSAINNRRQHERATDPVASSEIEVLIENGNYLIAEYGAYIITE